MKASVLKKPSGITLEDVPIVREGQSIAILGAGAIGTDALILKRFSLEETPDVLKGALRAPERVLRSLMIAQGG
jgi:hypothetical protein